MRLYLTSIGIEVPPTTDEFCNDWNFFEFWGMTREEFDRHCDDAVDAGFVFGDHEGLTRPNFFESLLLTKELGHENIIVTHRYQGSPGKAEENTRKWLEPYKYLIDELHFSGDKTSVPTDTFVEDNLKNYDALVEKGVKAFLINRPWNYVEGGDARNRIDDVQEYAQAIEDITLERFFDLSFS